MDSPQHVLARLDAIGQSLATSGHALALVGLGSVGVELGRLDRYSDLDFFVIAEDGAKPWFLEQIRWLSAVAPIAYAFRNTGDGYKVLFADGIFCEFAIFERAELRTIPFTQGRLVWKRPDIDHSIAAPVAAVPRTTPPSADWLIGEALTNLYVGLGRYHRGEKLSAMRFIQQYAVDRVLELAEQLEKERPVSRDPFSPERRYEQRFPGIAQKLPMFIQGYDRSRESARAILAFLAEHVAINQAMAEAILARCQEQDQ
ncbi:MAG TPA: hypothetical protein VFZ66_09160 [Herpetosiphonaceae bacterium]